MTVLRLLLAAIASMAAGPLLANSPVPSLEDKRQHACYDDVMRLCADTVPDAEATERCMLPKKKLVSPACAALYPPGK